MLSKCDTFHVSRPTAYRFVLNAVPCSTPHIAASQVSMCVFFHRCVFLKATKGINLDFGDFFLLHAAAAAVVHSLA